jgi:hypothetical protein
MRPLSLAKTVLVAAALGLLAAAALPFLFVVGMELHASKEAVAVLGAETWDPRTGAWSAAGAIDEPRVAPELALLGDGRVVVAGGYWGATPVTRALLWSPEARAFEDLGSPEIAIECQTATRLSDDRVLFASASEEGTWGIGVFHASLYDVAAKKWTRVAMTPDEGVRALAPLDGARALFVFKSHTAAWDPGTLAWTSGRGGDADGGSELACEDSAFARTLPDGRVLVVARVRHTDAREWAWLWDPGANALTPATALERAIAAVRPGDETEIDGLSLSPGGGVVVLGERAAYVAGAALDAVTAVPLPEDQRGGAAAVVAGRVLVAGGEKKDAETAAATTIDLATRQVARTGGLATPRWGGNAIALPDGRVLVVGGSVMRWDVSWGRFGETFLLGLLELAALAGLVWLGKRSGRPWVVAGVAIGVAGVVGGGGMVALTGAIGSAIKG